jgi:hypothetical protein
LVLIEILRLEHAEENLVVQAEARGVDLLRRTDASAYALLGCDPGSLHAAARAEAASEEGPWLLACCTRGRPLRRWRK